MRGDPDVKWRRRRAESKWLLVAAALLALLGVVVNNWDGPSWLLLGLAGCAAVGAVALTGRQGRAAAEDERATTLTTASQTDLGPTGRFRTVGETGWEEFRIQPAAVEVDYVPRDAEQELRDRLVEGRPVLVVGHSMSGKTWMAYQVVREFYRDWQVWIPERPNGLAQLMASGVPQQTVVWLDDLEAFLTSEQNLRRSWLTQLEDAGCRVVATIRSSEYEKFQPIGEVKPPQWEVLQRFALVRLFDDEAEQNRIAATVDDASTSAGIRRYGIAEYVGGGYLALNRFHNGEAAHPLAVAMLKAAADWRRLGFESIPEHTMCALAPDYLPEKIRATPGEDNAAALTRAAIEFGGRIKPLEPASTGEWRVFDFLLDYLSRDERPIPNAAWTAASSAARPHPVQQYFVGYQAYLDGRRNLAEELWREAATVIPQAAFNLGVLHDEQGDPDAAAAAYQLAVDSGHPDQAPMAAFNLGVLRLEQEEMEAAAAAFQLAIDTGHA
ncbi:MAG: tetratricopeptide repeat protein [Jatrophihabitantaceae bacterium]